MSEMKEQKKGNDQISIQVSRHFSSFSEKTSITYPNPCFSFTHTTQNIYNFALNTVRILFSTASRYSPVVT
jgi:hypothetical protein